MDLKVKYNFTRAYLYTEKQLFIGYHIMALII